MSIARRTKLLGQGCVSKVEEVICQEVAKQKSMGEVERKVTSKRGASLSKERIAVERTPAAAPTPTKLQTCGNSIECWHCGETRHTQRWCPNAKKKVDSQAGPTDSRSASSLRKRPFSEVECFKCRKKGHYADRCPTGRNRVEETSKDEEEEMGEAHVSGGSTYIAGVVGGIEIDLLLDNGCTHTLMDRAVWCRMEPRPEMRPNPVRMWAANGKRLKYTVNAQCLLRWLGRPPRGGVGRLHARERLHPGDGCDGRVGVHYQSWSGVCYHRETGDLGSYVSG